MEAAAAFAAYSGVRHTVRNTLIPFFEHVEVNPAWHGARRAARLGGRRRATPAGARIDAGFVNEVLARGEAVRGEATE